jgi:hypothetical protein
MVVDDDDPDQARRCNRWSETENACLLRWHVSVVLVGVRSESSAGRRAVISSRGP